LKDLESLTHVINDIADFLSPCNSWLEKPLEDEFDFGDSLDDDENSDA